MSKIRLGIVLFYLLILFNALTPRLSAQSDTRYIKAGASVNVRSGPGTTYKILGTLKPGTKITVTGANDKKDWLEIEYKGGTGWVAQFLTTTSAPKVSSGAVDSGGAAAGSGAATSTPAPNGPTCPSLSYTCSQLTCEQAYACLAAGNGGLDRDGDGKPCETQCGS